MRTKHRLLGAWAIMSVAVAACASRDRAAPTVEILSPPDQHVQNPGEPVQVETRIKDDQGVAQVELQVNGVAVDVAQAPAGEKSYRAVQSWTPAQAGVYRLTVIASDAKGRTSEPASITVTVGVFPSPTAPPEAQTESAAATVTPACAYGATFVADVTIPDRTHLAPGAEFVKTWRLRNTGSCDWGTGFQFVFVDGEQMGSPPAVDAPPTPTGGVVDVSVRFKAPDQPGAYRSRWRMRAPDGRFFGDRPFVLISVP